MRQTAAKRARSARNRSESSASVCSAVSEKGMPNCRRLLQTESLPQKLSRRVCGVILPAASGVACTSTGTPRFASRSASATPRSSPKFGKVTITPSILAALARKSSAQRLASSCVSTAPYLLCSGLSTTASIPARASASMTSSRPVLARTSGKKPRLPTMTPIVILSLPIILSFRRRARPPPGRLRRSVCSQRSRRADVQRVLSQSAGQALRRGPAPPRRGAHSAIPAWRNCSLCRAEAFNSPCPAFSAAW